MVREDESHRRTWAVAALPRRDGEIVQLYYYRELSVREVSEVLGMPVGTVKFRLFRCRRILAAVVEGTCNET